VSAGTTSRGPKRFQRLGLCFICRTPLQVVHVNLLITYIIAE